ncbi:hypothetical protein K7X08_006240 [Anisodus acutangulus]|uniref:Uncharacterized protein n=1 Tax=Anisodus acutangulus TaxID=402998 RepID=A0A9Q1MZB1_9SOLA|nr:hypothetical protein K7X08_006240 [Anisodus acutangulus]
MATSEAIGISHKRKEPSSSSDKGVEKTPSVVPLCKDKTKPFVSPNGVGIISEASSSNERNVCQEQHWKRLKKKHKDLGDQHNEFVDLDYISIDTAIFGDGATSLTMPLTELAQHVASNLEPQEAIPNFKLSYISGMWCTLCEWITQFYSGFLESLKQ